VNTERHQIEIRGIPVEVVRKDIQNLHLGVYPPSGRVRIAAPMRLGDEAIRMAVISRLAWIRRQQEKFAQQVRQSRREMVTGESHYFRGRRYRLEVVEADASPTVQVLSNTRLKLNVPPNCGREEREKILDRWYRKHLRKEIPGLLSKWGAKVGVQVSGWGIRKMKTRWGSCNAEAGRIWLNLELAKKPARCVEYILVHELVHLLERRHTERFQQLMDGLMPQWRTYRDELNRAPLAHQDWDY
jgi:predicted metal-dependent hydrolase